MDSSYTRTGLSVLSGDGSDGVDAYRTSIRNLATWAETHAALRGQGLLSARPAAGKAGTFYKATDAATGVLYYDNGSTWETVGASAPTDGPAATPSLRTLGSGSTQAAAGSHTHPIGAITGTGDSVTKNVGTAAGTVAAGNHTHSTVIGVTAVTKASDTARTSTTTLAADPDLQVAIATTGTYRVTALLSVTGDAVVDFKTAWSFGGTATVKVRGVVGPGTGTADVSNSSSVHLEAGSTTLLSSLAFGLDTGAHDSFVREDLIVAVTATGTLALQWAQNSSGSAVTLNAGSTVIVEKIA